jgi:hypothetical protein
MFERPGNLIPFRERLECCHLLARENPTKPYSEIRKELADKKTQYIMLRKHSKLIGLLVFKALQDGKNNYAQINYVGFWHSEPYYATILINEFDKLCFKARYYEAF